jgi:hypothetical protein
MRRKSNLADDDAPALAGEGGHYSNAQIREVQDFLEDRRLQSMRGIPLTVVACLIRLARGEIRPTPDDAGQF